MCLGNVCAGVREYEYTFVNALKATEHSKGIIAGNVKSICPMATRVVLESMKAQVEWQLTYALQSQVRIAGSGSAQISPCSFSRKSCD